MLRHKTILITGSSRGIGAETARLAKQYGANVILHGKTESKELLDLAEEIGSNHIFFDITNEQETIDGLKKIGTVDVLINNAGINPSKTFTELSSKDWRRVFEVNVFGLVNVSRAVLVGMLAQGHGKIINVASIKGFHHVTGKPAYAASKAAVMRITSSMAEEFSPTITVNAVAPGFTDTKMTAASMSSKIKEQIDTIPLKRVAEPQEIAETILFLASNKSDYITGQTITVDGGYCITT